MTAGLKRTPVVLLVFNRPERTRRVFEAVARARPPRLLVVADGPRADHPDDADQCRETRAVIEKVNWPCTVETNFADSNLGCRQRILTGLDWVFSRVEEAIILEDDCLPDASFFAYCEELLERYRDDPRVHMVRGGNFLRGARFGSDSYYFSRFYHIWGWATWARAWQCTDHQMRDWPRLRDERWLERTLPHPGMVERAREIFEAAFGGRLDTWEYHFVFGGWMRNALAISPFDNLVTNIGFGADATHFKSAVHPHSGIPTSPMRFPLRHPSRVAIHEKADWAEWRRLNPSELSLARRALRRILRLARIRIR